MILVIFCLFELFCVLFVLFVRLCSFVLVPLEFSSCFCSLFNQTSNKIAKSWLNDVATPLCLSD